MGFVFLQSNVCIFVTSSTCPSERFCTDVTGRARDRPRRHGSAPEIRGVADIVFHRAFVGSSYVCVNVAILVAKDRRKDWCLVQGRIATQLRADLELIWYNDIILECDEEILKIVQEQVKRCFEGTELCNKSPVGDTSARSKWSNFPGSW